MTSHHTLRTVCAQKSNLLFCVFIHKSGSNFRRQKGCAAWQPQLSLQGDGTVTSYSPHREGPSLKGKAGVRKQARDRRGCGGKEHKITLATVAARECKVCHSDSEKSPFLSAEITPTLTRSWDSKGVRECRHSYCKWKDSLTFKREHQIQEPLSL